MTRPARPPKPPTLPDDPERACAFVRGLAALVAVPARWWTVEGDERRDVGEERP